MYLRSQFNLAVRTMFATRKKMRGNMCSADLMVLLLENFALVVGPYDGRNF